MHHNGQPLAPEGPDVTLWCGARWGRVRRGPAKGRTGQAGKLGEKPDDLQGDEPAVPAAHRWGGPALEVKYPHW